MKTSSEHRRDFVDNLMNGILENYQQQLADRQELMCQDYLFRGFNPQQALEELHKELEEMFLGRGLQVRKLLNADDPVVSEVRRFENTHHLWDSQKKIHDHIMENFKGNRNKFLVTGPAGSGKSRLMAVLAENLKVLNIRTFCTALTAQLASQYHEGISFSNLLKIPPSEIDVILIDHGNLLPEEKFEELGEHLRNGSGPAFGGKTICVFADFKQFLPYTEDFKNQEEQSLEGKNIISNFEKLSLGPEISEFSFDKLNLVSTIHNLISETFGSALTDYDAQQFENRIILAPTNANVDTLNKEILQKVPGEPIILTSWSQAFSPTGAKLSERRYFTADANGVPDHQITLKPNCIISMLRSQDDLVKGNRLIFLSKTNSSSLKCRILSGPHKGQEVTVNQHHYKDEKVVLKYLSEKTFLLNRKQFPICLAYATTIHRAQGQFFDQVGLYNMDEAFDREAKYTAVTRCREKGGIRLFAGNSKSIM